MVIRDSSTCSSLEQVDHCCWILKKPVLPAGMVTVVLVVAPPDAMFVTNGLMVVVRSDDESTV